MLCKIRFRRGRVNRLISAKTQIPISTKSKSKNISNVRINQVLINVTFPLINFSFGGYLIVAKWTQNCCQHKYEDSRGEKILEK